MTFRFFLRIIVICDNNPYNKKLILITIMSKKAKVEDVDIQQKTEELARAEAQNLTNSMAENDGTLEPTAASEQPSPVGSLFGNIQYYNHEDVPNFFEKMTSNDAIFILLSSARYAQSKGIFSLEEGEAVSRAVRIITTPPQDQQSEESVG